ncbi:EamA family transporter [Solidesulfovibrio alcoholivorans]|uniref:EamA family transporter n=1 Tax=Solidesulfovibrio alcoholivorans TaxID=81406 RepID=UPI000694AAAF|nr:EamA family transporter [Solidesulfovibrio alcoholivorans]
MGTYYMSIAIVVLSNLFYHVFQKSIPQQFNPFISLVITYITAIVFSLILFPFYNTNITLAEHFRLSLWPSVALGFAIVGLEIGFLLAYRAGWDISIAAVFSNISVAIFLLPVGLLIYKENFTKTNFVGVILCIIGLVLVKR